VSEEGPCIENLPICKALKEETVNSGLYVITEGCIYGGETDGKR
jgi:hypothetical protein